MFNAKEMPISKETQKIIVKKLSSDQIFVLIIFAISALLFYFMVTHITSQIDDINIRLDRLIDINEQNLTTMRTILEDKME